MIRKSNTSAGEILRCSFCNKTQNDVRKLIAGPAVFICDACVEVCVDIITDLERVQPTQPTPEDLATRERLRVKVQSLPHNTVSCNLCGAQVSPEDVLSIEDRGVLCGGCADAVDEALSRGKPVA
jgi:ferredoxin